jgi:hypothetical protein
MARNDHTEDRKEKKKKKEERDGFLGAFPPNYLIG